MIIGAIMIVAGLALALSGSFKFNFGIVATGYAVAFAGAVVFVTRLVEVLT